MRRESSFRMQILTSPQQVRVVTADVISTSLSIQFLQIIHPSPAGGGRSLASASLSAGRSTAKQSPCLRLHLLPSWHLMSQLLRLPKIPQPSSFLSTSGSLPGVTSWLSSHRETQAYSHLVGARGEVGGVTLSVFTQVSVGGNCLS